MKKIVLISIGLTIFLSLFAVPYTTMGNLRVPDAYVLPHKSAEFTFTNYFRREASSFTSNKPYEYVPMGMINIGLFDRIGLGAWAGDEILFANVKVKIIEETVSIPQVAVGIDNLFSEIKEDANNPAYSNYDWFSKVDRHFYERNSPYITFTKASVIKGMTGLPLLETYITLGVGRNKFRGQVDLAKRFEGVFGSITIKPAKNVSLTFENDGFNINAGGLYTYKNFGFKISYVGIEEQENNRIGLGISYLFDKYADPKRKQIQVGDDRMLESDAVRSQYLGKDVDVNRDLLEELKKLREQREQAQKVLEELKNQMKEMEEGSTTE